MFQFSLSGYFRFFSRKSIGSNFCACLHAHKFSQKFELLACIHIKWVSLFSRVVIFAGGNFRIFSRRENYNSAKINVLKVCGKWEEKLSTLLAFLIKSRNPESIIS